MLIITTNITFLMERKVRLLNMAETRTTGKEIDILNQRLEDLAGEELSDFNDDLELNADLDKFTDVDIFSEIDSYH
jgi:hypothetical protein